MIKRFEIGRKIYNSVLGKALNRYNEMIKEFKLTEYSLHQDVKLVQHTFKKNIDSFTAQKVASRVGEALETNIFGKGAEVHFKGRNNPLN